MVDGICYHLLKIALLDKGVRVKQVNVGGPRLRADARHVHQPYRRSLCYPSVKIAFTYQPAVYYIFPLPLLIAYRQETGKARETFLID